MEQKDLFPKDTPVIFLPFPENQHYKHHGKKGKIIFKALRGTAWYINLDETMLINKGTPMEKVINIKVLGGFNEFEVTK